MMTIPEVEQKKIMPEDMQRLFLDMDSVLGRALYEEICKSLKKRNVASAGLLQKGHNRKKG
jgi:hypothetical protein